MLPRMESRQRLFLSCIIAALIVTSVSIEMKADKCMKKQMPFVIACDVGLITREVFFYNDGEKIVTCVPPGQPCDTAATTCSLSKDNSTALLVIDAVDCKKDSGDWYCKHGTEISNKFKMDCSQCTPCVKFAKAAMVISCLLVVCDVIMIILFIIMCYRKCWEELQENKCFKLVCFIMEIASVLIGTMGVSGLAMHCEMNEGEVKMSVGMDSIATLLGLGLMTYEFIKSLCSHKAEEYNVTSNQEDI